MWPSQYLAGMRLCTARVGAILLSIMGHPLWNTYSCDVYDDSSINHSVPGGGGSVLFHTHTFSHFTGTYALLQLPFCMDSDVGCLYRCPFGMKPAIA